MGDYRIHDKRESVFLGYFFNFNYIYLGHLNSRGHKQCDCTFSNKAAFIFLYMISAIFYCYLMSFFNDVFNINTHGLFLKFIEKIAIFELMLASNMVKKEIF